MKTETKSAKAEIGSGYRFENFKVSVMTKDIRFSRKALKPGQVIPNLEVITSEGKQIKLYQLAETKPLLIVTGSLTCPMTVSSLPSLKALEEQLDDRVAFALLYVREAHPGDNYPQPQSLREKIQNASEIQKFYGISWPVIIDDIDGTLHRSLDIKPNSAHLMSKTGEILFRSLWAGDVSAVEQALNQFAKGQLIQRKTSQRMMGPFIRVAGFMDEILRQAGPRAYRELAFGAPPIALLARVARTFDFLPQNKRGLASMLVLGALTIAVVLGVLQFI